jgi:hypothetical protein
MSCTRLTLWNRPSLVALATLFALAPALVGEARAACFTPRVADSRGAAPGARGPLSAGKAQFAAAAAAALATANDDNTPASSVVGLWNTTYLLGEGPDVYDQAYQQFHADGNENMLSRGLPPSLGNVCLGIWKRVGPRTFTVKHVAWNWNGDGSFAGTFSMNVTFRLDRRAARYTGTWEARNFAPDGTLIPELNAGGVVNAVRVAAD